MSASGSVSAGVADLCAALATVGTVGDELAYLVAPTTLVNTPTSLPNVTYAQLLQLCQQGEMSTVKLLTTLANEFHAVVAFLAFICLAILLVGCLAVMNRCRRPKTKIANSRGKKPLV